jgi:hypothetical protein
MMRKGLVGQIAEVFESFWAVVPVDSAQKAIKSVANMGF